MKVDPYDYYQAIEVVQRLRAMCDDVDAVLAGLPPTERLLARAPLLTGWEAAPYEAICLIGQVSGHPLIDDGPLRSSQVYMIDPDQRWARTISRFYRLGTRNQYKGI